MKLYSITFLKTTSCYQKCKYRTNYTNITTLRKQTGKISKNEMKIPLHEKNVQVARPGGDAECDRV